MVRTIGNAEVTGLVSRLYEADSRWTKALMQVVDPGGTFNRGALTCYETRVPCEVPFNRDAASSAEQPILPNPYEVATVFVDAVTKFHGLWRIAIQMEPCRNKNGHIYEWVCTCTHIGAQVGTPLVSCVLRDLETLGFRETPKKEIFPINRHLKQTAEGGQPETDWDRLKSDE